MPPPRHPGFTHPQVKYIGLFLLLAAFAVIQTFIGGAKLLYSLPAYAILGALAPFVLVGKVRYPRGLSLACVLGTLAWMGYTLARNRLSPVEYLARPDFFMVLGCLLVYLLVAFYFTEARQRLILLCGLLVFAFVQAVIGAVQFKQSDAWMVLPWVFRLDYDSWRASGFYICPNHFAGLMEVMALMALGITFWSRWKLGAKMLTGYAAVACLMGVALSGSRGGYLSIACGITAFAILSLVACRKLFPRRFPLAILASVAVAAILIGGSVFIMLKSDTLRTRLGQVYEPKNMRLLMWQAALEQHEINPWFGTGAGTYLYYGRQFRHASVQNDPIFVHNDYLHLLAEYGNVGAFLCLLFLGTHLKSGFRGLRLFARRAAEDGRTGRNGLALAIGALSAVAALLAHSVVDFNLHIPANALLMAWIFGILASPGIGSEPSGRAGVLQLWAGRITIAGLGAATLWLAVPKIEAEYYAERARMALRDRMFPEAVAFASAGLATEKLNPDLYYYRGETRRMIASHSQREKTELNNVAIRDLKSALLLFPNDVRITLKLARALDASRRWADAEALLKRALVLDPNLGNVHAFYGLHFHQQGRREEAQWCYEQALKLGGNPIAKTGLQEIKEERKREQERILKLLNSGGDMESLILQSHD